MSLSAFFFCLMTVFVKLVSNDLETIQIVLVRGILTLLFTFIITKRKKVYIWGENHKLLIARGLTGSVALFFVYESIQRLSLSEATSIQYLYPIFTSIFAFFMISENLSKKIFYSVFMGFLGVYMVLDFPFIQSNSNINISSLIIAILGSLLTALAYVLVRLASKKDESPYVIMFYFPLFTVPLSLPFAYFNWNSPGIEGWFFLLMVGICTQLGQTFLTFGYKLLPASKAALTSYIQVPFSAMFGYLLFFEPISFNFILGSFIIFISIYIIIKKK